MASTTTPFERFGSFLLFKKIESDATSELWRAGQIDGAKLGPTVALRRFTGGDAAALRAAAEHAAAVVSALTGTTVVRNQSIGFVGDTPYLVHEYSGGRTLQTVVNRARGSQATQPNPIPLDQALAICEKLASSCETLANVRYQGARLVHGALIPQFVWISEEGEVRAAGQQLGKGLVASLKGGDAGRDLAGYFAPELRAGGEATKTSDVYSLGAILFLMLTGEKPAPFADAAALKQTLDGAKLAGRNEPIPADIRPLLERSLNPDPAGRYQAASEMRQALEKLLGGSEYAATTFNLAFYLHSLLRKDMEVEAAERPREEEVDLAPYLAASAAPAAPAKPAAPERPASVAVPFGAYATSGEDEPKSKTPLIIAVVALLAIAGGAWAVLRPKAKATPVATAQAAQAATTTAKPIEPIVAAPPSTDSAATATLDPEAKKKMIEDAVNKRLQEEMMKLQTAYNSQLQQQKVMKPSVTGAAPAAVAAAPAPARDERPAMSAAQLDQQRRAQAAPEPTAAPATQTTAAVAAPAAPAPAPPTAQAAPSVKEGDLVAVTDLDQIPELRSPVRPTYPPMAVARKLEATIIVSALINERGQVSDVKILRGETVRGGFDDAAMRAVRAAVFTPPVKNGAHVKTWKPLPVVFKLH